MTYSDRRTQRPPMVSRVITQGVVGEGQSPHPEVGRTSDEVRTQRPAAVRTQRRTAELVEFCATCVSPRHLWTISPHPQ